MEPNLYIDKKTFLWKCHDGDISCRVLNHSDVTWIPRILGIKKLILGWICMNPDIYLNLTKWYGYFDHLSGFMPLSLWAQNHKACIKTACEFQVSDFINVMKCSLICRVGIEKTLYLCQIRNLYWATGYWILLCRLSRFLDVDIRRL